ncbi:cytochrome P450 [Streptomyces sp. NPDC056508]|uniref:cytochrome P450 n=1 Tax=unclassified Streptomyces TaxID=2593676 RepID=UPI00344C3560
MLDAPAPDAADAPRIRFWAVPHLTGLDFDPLLAELLHEDPVTRIRLPHGDGHAWLVTRYEDVRFVSADPRFSRRAARGRPVTRVAPRPVPLEGDVGFADPPDHTRMRRVLARAFGPGPLRTLRDRAQEAMDRLLDRVEDHGAPADLVELVHRPFPLAVAGALMGVPEGDRPLLAHWAATAVSADAGRRAGERARADAVRYFTELVGRSHGSGGETLAAVLADAVDDGALTGREAAGLAFLVLTGGTHAVRNNTAHMVYALLTHPEHLARLRAEPALLPRAVDELLRYIPHRDAVGLPRIALEDVEVGGVVIPAGDPVYVSHLTANRDPAVFPEPDRLDFDRDRAPHLAFGHGPHACPGAALARIESEVLVASLWDRFPDLRLAVPAERLRWQRGTSVRGPETLPVTW